MMPRVYQDGKRLLSQPEKENSNMSLDWRKRVVFLARLMPFQMNRFSVRLEPLPKKPSPELDVDGTRLLFKTKDVSIVINTLTGFLDSYLVGGKEYIRPGACVPLVVDDYDDSWGATRFSYRDVVAPFSLLPVAEGSSFSGLTSPLPSVRIIEDGDVRTVVEVLLGYSESRICMRYKLPKSGTEIEIEMIIQWNEKSKMLKFSLPTALCNSKYVGQTAYGIDTLFIDGRETVSQGWAAAVSNDGNCFTINKSGIYGSDFLDGEIRLSLLRSPGYACADMSQFELGKGRPLMPTDRYSPRIDQGEHFIKLRIHAGPTRDRLSAIERECDVFQEKPYALSYSPPGKRAMAVNEAFVLLSDKNVQLTTLKKEERGEEYILRVYESSGTERSAEIAFPSLGIKERIHLNSFEIKTYRLDTAQKRLTEVTLMEEPIEEGS